MAMIGTEVASGRFRVRKLTTSGIVIALYIVILFMTQSFSFGAYQIRIVTSLYALSYLFPFLVIPLGLANHDMYPEKIDNR